MIINGVMKNIELQRYLIWPRQASLYLNWNFYVAKPFLLFICNIHALRGRGSFNNCVF